jgi:hypothetical protein
MQQQQQQQQLVGRQVQGQAAALTGPEGTLSPDADSGHDCMIGIQLNALSLDWDMRPRTASSWIIGRPPGVAAAAAAAAAARSLAPGVPPCCCRC